MDKNKLYKDIVKEEMLEKFNEVIDNKDEYQANDVFRVRFLKDNIDEVVSVMLAGEANRRAGLSEEYKQAEREYDIEFAMIVKDKIMQEIYESFGYSKKLPTSAEGKEMKRRHVRDLKYLMLSGASSEYIEVVRYINQLELNLFECKRGELYKQFGNNDRAIVKISHDVYVEGHDNIEKAKQRYKDKYMKVKSKKQKSYSFSTASNTGG